MQSSSLDRLVALRQRGAVLERTREILQGAVGDNRAATPAELAEVRALFAEAEQLAEIAEKALVEEQAKARTAKPIVPST